MGKHRQIIVYPQHFDEQPIICKGGKEALAITGGKLSTLHLHLRKGWSFNGWRVEYVRHDPPAVVITAMPCLDKWMRNHKPIKVYRRPVRLPLLARRHITMHLGVFR